MLRQACWSATLVALVFWCKSNQCKMLLLQPRTALMPIKDSVAEINPNGFNTIHGGFGSKHLLHA